MKIDQIHLYWPKQNTFVKNLQERTEFNKLRERSCGDFLRLKINIGM